MRVNKCCCCISVKTGVYIIGVWHLIIMIAGLFEAEYVRVSLELFTAISFIILVAKDSANTRQFFFVTYSIFCVLFNIVMLFRSYKFIKHKDVQREKCMDP